MSMRRVLIAAIGLLLLGLALYVVLQPSQPPIGASVISLKSNDSTAGYARADRVRVLKFPEDHGPHPDFQTEWWYFVGNLDTDDGRHFGYELTFFRRALTPTMSTRESDWELCHQSRRAACGKALSAIPEGGTASFGTAMTKRRAPTSRSLFHFPFS